MAWVMIQGMRNGCGALALGFACLAACGNTSKHPGATNGQGAEAAADGGDAGADAAGGTTSSAGKASGGSQTGGSQPSGGKAAAGEPAVNAGGTAESDCLVDLQNDPEHCGGCDIACSEHSACVAGKCTPELMLLTEMPDCGTLALQRAENDLAPGILYALGSKNGLLSRIELPDTGDGKPKTLASGLVGVRSFEMDTMAMGNTVLRIDSENGKKTVYATDTSPVTATAWNVGSGDLYYATGSSIKLVQYGEPGNSKLVLAGPDDDEIGSLGMYEETWLIAWGKSQSIQTRRRQANESVTIATAQSELVLGHRSLQTYDAQVCWASGALKCAPVEGEVRPVSTLAHPIDDFPIVAYAIDPIDRISYFVTSNGSFEKATFAQQTEATLVARNLPNVTSVVLDATHVYIASECKIWRSTRWYPPDN